MLSVMLKRLKALGLLLVMVLTLVGGSVVIVAADADLSGEVIVVADNTNDEFVDSDEFSSMEFDEEFNDANTSSAPAETVSYSKVYWALLVIVMTILSGIMVRYKFTRRFKGVMLLFSLVVLGFYHGGGACMISSFQNTWLMMIGEKVEWQSILWFLVLIPLTYIFGQVWCGWACHLGAFQEFLMLPGKISLFRSARAQKVMRIIRTSVLVILLTQLFITHTNIYKHFGPFKVAFNLFSPNLTGYILLGVLLLSSLFVYRPFCRSICPIGLILGWIAKIPGAGILGINQTCISCNSCNTSCRIDAITRGPEKVSKLDNQDCIVCGECLDACPKSSISFYRKGKEHHVKIKMQKSE
jgi:polyferredoxin